MRPTLTEREIVRINIYTQAGLKIGLFCLNIAIGNYTT